MSHYLLYWRVSTVESDDPSRVQSWAGSEWIGKDNVRPGDVLWAVTSREVHDLRLVARIPVERVVHTRAEAVAVVGDQAWAHTEHFAFGREEDCRSMQDIDLSGIARKLTFEGSVRRLPKEFGGKNLQRMRRLTLDSAAVMQRAWDEGELSKPPRFVWQKDELILALDLYLRLDRTVADEGHDEVISLSKLLRSLPIHANRHLDPTFRNPEGVALKLANFRAIERPGHGMTRGNRLEKVVWDEFSDAPERLRQVAALIGGSHKFATVQEPAASQDEEEEFPEGRIAYRLHCARERSRELVRRKKEQARKVHGCLRCEVCAFDFEVRYGDLGKDYIECHHTLPVSRLPQGATTKLEDVALVCSNCHRMIHRFKQWLPIQDIRQLIRGAVA